MKIALNFPSHSQSGSSSRPRGLFYKLLAEARVRSKHFVSCAVHPGRHRVRTNRNRDLLSRLYREILLREPDRQILTSQIRLLNMERITPLELEKSMRESVEFRSIVTPLSREVESVYDQYIFRKPTLAELSNHANIFRSQSPMLADLVQAAQSKNLRSNLGIRPLTLEMDITNQCNLRCVMCYFSDESVYRRKREDLSLADFARIAEQLFPLCQEVGLSIGTEPLLHKKFSEMLAILPQYKIPHTFITTNGLLLSESVIAEMIRNNFTRVNISMDAATRQTYERIRVGSNFDKVINNIRAINHLKEKAGSATPTTCLVFVLMRSNIRELPAFIRLAHELKAVAVTTIHMVPYEMLNNAHESLSLEKELCNRMLDEARLLAKKYGISFAGPSNFPEPQPLATQLCQIAPVADATSQAKPDPIENSVHRFESNLGHAEAESLCCPFPWHFIGIESSGNVTPCGWWYKEKPMGNLKTQTFQEIWSNEQYRTLRAEHRTRNLRKTCEQCPAAGVGHIEHENAFSSREVK